MDITQNSTESEPETVPERQRLDGSESENSSNSPSTSGNEQLNPSTDMSSSSPISESPTSTSSVNHNDVEAGHSKSPPKRRHRKKDITQNSTESDSETVTKRQRLNGCETENSSNNPSTSGNQLLSSSTEMSSNSSIPHCSNSTSSPNSKDDEEGGPSQSPPKRRYRKKEKKATSEGSEKPKKRKSASKKVKTDEPSTSAVPRPKRTRKSRSKKTSKDSDCAGSSSVNRTVPSSSEDPAPASIPSSSPAPSTSSNADTNQNIKTSADESLGNDNHTVEQSASTSAAPGEQSNSTPSNAPVIDDNNQAASYVTPSSSTGTAETPSSSTGTATGSSTPDTNEDPSPNSGTATNGNFRDRFNRRNTQVIPLRHASELIVGALYRIHNVQRVNTRYGPSIRAEIADDRSPVSRSFLFLPTRFRDTSDEDIRQMNEAAEAGDLHLIYRGRIGKADIIDII